MLDQPQQIRARGRERQPDLAIGEALHLPHEDVTGLLEIVAERIFRRRRHVSESASQLCPQLGHDRTAAEREEPGRLALSVGMCGRWRRGLPARHSGPGRERVRPDSLKCSGQAAEPIANAGLRGAHRDPQTSCDLVVGVPRVEGESHR